MNKLIETSTYDGSLGNLLGVHGNQFSSSGDVVLIAQSYLQQSSLKASVFQQLCILLMCDCVVLWDCSMLLSMKWASTNVFVNTNLATVQECFGAALICTFCSFVFRLAEGSIVQGIFLLLKHIF